MGDWEAYIRLWRVVLGVVVGSYPLPLSLGVHNAGRTSGTLAETLGTNIKRPLRCDGGRDPFEFGEQGSYSCTESRE